MKCKNCGNEIKDGEKFCKNCGIQTTEKDCNNSNPETTKKKKGNNNTKEKQKFSWKKDGKKVIFAIVALIILIAVIVPKDEDETDNVQKNSVKILTEATELDKEDATAIYNDFKSVGIEELTSCKLKSEEGGVKTYDFKCKKCDGSLEIKDKKTSVISSNSIFLFTSLNGAEKNINDYYIDNDKKLELLTRTEKVVKESLKSPASAEFPDQVWDSGDWQITRCKNIVTITSHVDSQNSLGAMIRSNFTCQASYDKEELLYLNIDGKNVYGTFVKTSE